MADLEKKYSKIKALLNDLDRLVVAFSGGIDSTVLLKIASDTLKGGVLAVTADSASVPRQELNEAQKIAAEIGARHEFMNTNELMNPNYASNPVNRCFFCKTELYAKLTEIAKRENIKHIANGTNLDDLGDYRPGLQAATAFKVMSPLKDAELTKADVRALAKELAIPIWDKPASPCLASRIPYGSSVTTGKLASIERSESFLKSIGIRELRVRHFGSKARIEVPKDDFNKISSNMTAIRAQFARAGFNEIEVEEFQSGALNINVLSNVSQET